MIKIINWLILVSIGCLLSSNVFAKALDKAEDFALLDQDGIFHELYYYSDKKAIVLIDASAINENPSNIANLRKIKDTFEPQGVEFLMIDTDAMHDRYVLKQKWIQYGLNIPILEDASGVITNSLNFSKTSYLQLINPINWSVVFKGKISDLRNAIKLLLANRPMPKITVEPDKAIDKDIIDFNKDVAPIIVHKCMQCHITNGIAPWSADGYEKIKGRSAMIREVLRTRRMPPWHADSYYGHFKDDFSLSSAEERTLVRWIEQGALKQDSEDVLAKQGHFNPDGWAWGKPDIIFKLKEKQEVPASGGEQYVFVDADKPVTKDLWVKGVYWKPENPAILHHGNLVVQSGETNQWLRDSGMDMSRGQMIDGYSPGEGPFMLPNDTGYFIPKGSKLVFGLHYITTGKPQTDRTQVGLYLYQRRPSSILSVFVLSNRLIRIPAGEKDYRVSASGLIKDNITLFAIQPHMHYHGRSMRVRVEYPNGKFETLLSVPQYRFRWQHRYILKEPKKLPAGSRIWAEGSFDNSAQNPDNPDPSKEVRYGPSSREEMFSCIIYYVKGKNEF